MQEIANSCIGTKPSVWTRVKGRALKVTTLGMGAAFLVSRVAADDTVFGINGTQIDDMFSALNQHILPDVGQTISAMPQIIIPIVILVVLIMILLFVPNLLHELLQMLKEAMHINPKK